MLQNLGRQLRLSSIRCLTLSGTSQNIIESQFFDAKENYGKYELRPKHRPGRSWMSDELRLKSNTDLHKLWYVCLKERNMLKTMERAYLSKARQFPNPERLDRVNETMNNIEAVIHERNNAYFCLETGDSADPPQRTVTSFMGFTYKQASSEHYALDSEKKLYEVPYLDDDAYMMQKLWQEKEFMKKRDREDIDNLKNVQNEEMKRFRRGGPRNINRLGK